MIGNLYQYVVVRNVVNADNEEISSNIIESGFIIAKDRDQARMKVVAVFTGDNLSNIDNIEIFLNSF